MPLENSTSSKARERNTRREIEAGKPVKQAVAIGYAVQRRAESGHRHPQRLDRDKVSKWTKGERSSYG